MHVLSPKTGSPLKRESCIGLAGVKRNYIYIDDFIGDNLKSLQRRQLEKIFKSQYLLCTSCYFSYMERFAS